MLPPYRNRKGIPWCPPPPEPTEPEWTPTLVDMRDKQTNPPRSASGAAISSVRGGKARTRPPSAVDGVCLHQAGVVFGGDPPWERAIHVACHAMAFRGGVGVISADPSWWMSGAGPLNERTVHLEVDGLYRGVIGDDSTAWQDDGVVELDERTLLTAKATLTELVRITREWGADLQYIYAHRQSSAMRRSDPGEEIWRELVPWAEAYLDLSPRFTFTLDAGKPIPLEWDERGKGRY